MKKQTKKILITFSIIFAIILLIVGFVSLMVYLGIFQQSALGSFENSVTSIDLVDSEGITFTHGWNDARGGAEGYGDGTISGAITSKPFSTSSLPSTTIKENIQVGVSFPAQGIAKNIRFYTNYQSGLESVGGVDVSITGNCKIVKQYEYNQKWVYEAFCDFMGKLPDCQAQYGCGYAYEGSSGSLQFKIYREGITPPPGDEECPVNTILCDDGTCKVSCEEPPIIPPKFDWKKIMAISLASLIGIGLIILIFVLVKKGKKKGGKK